MNSKYEAISKEAVRFATITRSTAARAHSLGYFRDHNAADVGCVNNVETWNKIAPPEELMFVKAR